MIRYVQNIDKLTIKRFLVISTNKNRIHDVKFYFLINYDINYLSTDIRIGLKKSVALFNQ